MSSPGSARTSLVSFLFLFDCLFIFLFIYLFIYFLFLFIIFYIFFFNKFVLIAFRNIFLYSLILESPGVTQSQSNANNRNYGIIEEESREDSLVAYTVAVAIARMACADCTDNEGDTDSKSVTTLNPSFLRKLLFDLITLCCSRISQKSKILGSLNSINSSPQQKMCVAKSTLMRAGLVKSSKGYAVLTPMGDRIVERLRHAPPDKEIQKEIDAQLAEFQTVNLDFPELTFDAIELPEWDSKELEDLLTPIDTDALAALFDDQSAA